MTGDDIASLAYLGLLGAVIAGLYFTAERRNLAKMTQQALIWVLIFVGAVAAVGLWMDVRPRIGATQTVSAEGALIATRQPDGHYHLRALVNGVPVDFVVDTGASDIVLSLRDARRIGIDPSDLRFIGQAQTANGTVRTAPVRLDSLAVGPFEDTGLRAVVNEGDLFGSLLGMSYLSRYHIQISGDRMVLTR